MRLPPVADELLNELLAGMGQTLGDTLVGVYLRGSVATGDFDPATSDLDVLAVTARPVDDAGFAMLGELHGRLAGLPNPYADRLEIAYIDAAALRRYQPGRRHPTLGRGETLVWAEHGENWVLERWVVREQGIVLLGPAPQRLIDPIPQDDLVAAVRARLADWAAWANQPDNPDWRLPLKHKAYVVETMCRALYALRRGELAGKRQAVAWALATLDEPWRDLVATSQSWRNDATVDLRVNSDVRRFVWWVAGAG